jgi:hypothetical protein
MTFAKSLSTMNQDELPAIEGRLLDEMRSAKTAKDFDTYREAKFKLSDVRDAMCDECEIAAQTY